MIGDEANGENVSESGKIVNEPGIEMSLANNSEKFQISCRSPGQIIIEENEHMIGDEVEYIMRDRHQTSISDSFPVLMRRN